MAKGKTMQRGYRDVGYLFAPHIRAFRPAQYDARSWRKHVTLLDEHVSNNEKGEIRLWFKTHYPALMHLIPERRHCEFVIGYVERVREDTGSCGAIADVDRDP